MDYIQNIGLHAVNITECSWGILNKLDNVPYYMFEYFFQDGIQSIKQINKYILPFCF